MFSDAIKAEIVLWYAEKKSPTKVQRMFRAKYGKHRAAPKNTDMQRWSKNFKEAGVLSTKRSRSGRVDRQQIIRCIEENPKQSLRRLSNNLNVSVTTIRKCLKAEGYKNYGPHIVQALKESDKVARVNFAQHMLDEISRCPDFLDRIIFSDEAIFHLEGGVNTHNCTHWSKTNPHWTIEKSLNSPKVMVWAAIGTSGIIGPIFFQENVGGESYLKLLMEDFFPVFCNLPNSSNLLFQQDGAPPHWALHVRNWLNNNLADRWIGRGGPNDRNITWPPRSPDLTPLDFYLWGHIKSLVYVKNYENLTDLKNSISAAFQEVTQETVSASIKNLAKRLKLVVQNGGAHIEK